MSADNGIYILQSLDGYRIIHAQAIENLYWWDNCCDNPDVVDDELKEDCFYHTTCKNCGSKDPESENRHELNPKILKQYFGKSTVYDTEKEVMEEACNIYEEIEKDDMGILEYGISFIRGWKDKFFPGVVK